MEKLKRKSQIVLLILLPVLLSACFAVRVVENVKDPGRFFGKAYNQIERIHEQYPRREGDPHSIHVLIYEGSDRKIIKVSAPLWTVNACMDLGMWAAEKGNEFDFEERYDIDWRGLRDLGQIGPGLLVEVDDEENKILIWLE